MKTILCNTHQINTPWLNRSEACAYLTISEASFTRLNRRLPCPHGGAVTNPRYHTEILTAWFKRIGTETP